jgi:limonene-1,2-epoxide hydrolase
MLMGKSTTLTYLRRFANSHEEFELDIIRVSTRLELMLM